MSAQRAPDRVEELHTHARSSLLQAVHTSRARVRLIKRLIESVKCTGRHARCDPRDDAERDAKKEI